jgi:hypothetical protein
MKLSWWIAPILSCKQVEIEHKKLFFGLRKLMDLHIESGYMLTSTSSL